VRWVFLRGRGLAEEGVEAGVRGAGEGEGGGGGARGAGVCGGKRACVASGGWEREAG